MFRCRIFPISSSAGETPKEVEAQLNSLFEQLYRIGKTPIVKTTANCVIVLWIANAG